MVKLNKKNKQVRDEFKTPTQRVGKKKLDASNSTRADVRAKTLHVPKQSIMQSKVDSSIPTVRGHDIKTLLQHTKHHNIGFKRQGLQHLFELCSQNVDHLPSWIGQISQETIDLATDADVEIRRRHKKLLELICEKVPLESLQPFSQFFHMMVVSALTHLLKEVRDHGVTLACLPIMESCPRLVPLILSYLAGTPKAAASVSVALGPLLDRIFLEQLGQLDEDLLAQSQVTGSLMPALAEVVSGQTTQTNIWPVGTPQVEVDARVRSKHLTGGLRALLHAWMELGEGKEKVVTPSNRWGQVKALACLRLLMRVAANDEDTRVAAAVEGFAPVIEDASSISMLVSNPALAAARQAAAQNPKALAAKAQAGTSGNSAWDSELDVTTMLDDIDSQVFVSVHKPANAVVCTDEVANEMHAGLLASIAAPFASLVRNRMARLAPASSHQLQERSGGRLRHPSARLLKLVDVLSAAADSALKTAALITDSAFHASDVQRDPLGPSNVGAPSSAPHRLLRLLLLVVELVREASLLRADLLDRAAVISRRMEEAARGGNEHLRDQMEVVPVRKLTEAAERLDALVVFLLRDVLVGQIVFGDKKADQDTEDEGEETEAEAFTVKPTRRLLWSSPLLLLLLGVSAREVVSAMRRSDSHLGGQGAFLPCPPSLAAAISQLAVTLPGGLGTYASVCGGPTLASKVRGILVDSFAHLPAEAAEFCLRFHHHSALWVGAAGDRSPPRSLLDFFHPVSDASMDEDDDEEDEKDALVLTAPEEVRVAALRCLSAYPSPGGEGGRAPNVPWAVGVAANVLQLLDGDELAALSTLVLREALASGSDTPVANVFLEVLAGSPLDDATPAEQRAFTAEQLSVLFALSSELLAQPRFETAQAANRKLRFVGDVAAPLALRLPCTGLPALQEQTLQAGGLWLSTLIALAFPQARASAASPSSSPRVAESMRSSLLLSDKFTAPVRSVSPYTRREWSSVAHRLIPESVRARIQPSSPTASLGLVLPLAILRVAQYEGCLSAFLLLKVRLLADVCARYSASEAVFAATALLDVDFSESVDVSSAVSEALLEAEVQAKLALGNLVAIRELPRDLEPLVAKLRLRLQGSLLG